MLVKKLDKLMSLDARGAFGYSGGFGAIRFGFTRLGFFDNFCGIYQRKKTLKGWSTSRQTFYRPTNPQTILQQNWRAVFAQGWVEYAGLTAEQRLLLSKQALSYGMTGPNLFMRRWLQQNR